MATNLYRVVGMKPPLRTMRVTYARGKTPLSAASSARDLWDEDGASITHFSVYELREPADGRQGIVYEPVQTPMEFYLDGGSFKDVTVA